MNDDRSSFGKGADAPGDSGMNASARHSAPLLHGIDHVAITVADLEASCLFYHRLFHAEVMRDHAPDGRPSVRVIIIGGGARLSIHQAGNGVDLVARHPTPGSGDICFRWAGTIHQAADHLAACGVAIVDGPSPRETADRLPARSIYFHDPDGNLIELMAADQNISAAGCKDKNRGQEEYR